MPFVETEYPNDAIRGGGQLDVAATAPLLNGQKVCVIGRFLAMTQADVVEVVRRHGGLLVGYPSPDTSLVVVGGDGWPCLRDGSPSPLALRVQELRRAEAGLAVISEEELFARLGLVEPGECICRELTVAELGRVLGLRASQVRRWARLGLVTPRRTVHRLAFFDLAQVASAKRICELIVQGVSLANIRRGLEQIDRWLPQHETPLSQLALLEHDGQILVRLNGTLAETNGQLRFNFDPPGDMPTVAPAREDSESLFDEALAAEDAQDLPGAVELYGRAVRLDPADPILHFNLGNVLFGLSRYREAADSYQRGSGWTPATPKPGTTWATPWPPSKNGGRRLPPSAAHCNSCHSTRTRSTTSIAWRCGCRSSAWPRSGTFPGRGFPLDIPNPPERHRVRPQNGPCFGAWQFSLYFVSGSCDGSGSTWARRSFRGGSGGNGACGKV